MRNANIRRGHSARSYNHNSSQSSLSDFVSQYMWHIVWAVIVIFFAMKIFGGGSDSLAHQGNFLSITPQEKATVFITDADGKKTQISASGSLYTAETLTVETGYTTAKLGSSNFDFGTNSEIQYKEKKTDNNTTQDTVKISKGIAWVDSASDSLFLELDNLSAKISAGSVAMFEQSNSVFSSVYAIRGEVQIMTEVGQYTLTPGKKISLSSGDSKNANTNLSDKVNDFDSSVAKMEIFIRNDGETFLKASSASDTENSSDSEEQNETSTESWETASGATQGKYISFTQPIDGATIKTATTTIMGTLLSTEVARVTLNDIDTVISPVNESFTMEEFALENGINNIVYKVYSANALELERGVLIVHGAATASKVNTIVPENFPNLKDFVITSPAKNPYATTESYVKVQGIVPAKTVKYITVNGYRLQKFVPNSTTWYYHANASIGTIKEGTNLYHIKFYDANDREIHTQIFTIIKDSPNAQTTTNQTSITNDDGTTELAPLFPTT